MSIAILTPAPPRGSRAAAAFVGATSDAGVAQRRLLPARVLRVGRRAADVRDHRPVARELGERVGEPAGRVGVRAVPEHHVEQHAAARRRGRSREHRRAAPRGRPSGAGGPGCTPPRRGRRSGGRRRRRRPRSRRRPSTAQDRHRLVGERAAGEEPEQRPSRRGARRPVGVRRRRHARGGERAGLERGVDLERRRRRRPSRRTRRRPACRRRRPRRARARPRAAGGLETSSSVSVAVVGSQQPHRLPEHDPADVRGQVAAADADDLGHPAAGTRRAGSLPPARRCRPAATMPDRSRADGVREPEPDAAEHRGAALGPHHQQPALGAAALERELVGHRDVVGEQEDVHARGQRAVGLEHGVLARERNQREVGRVELARGGAERARLRPPVRGRVRRRRRRAKLALGVVERARGSVHGVDRDDDVGRPGVARHAASGQRLEVRRGAHQHLARAHAVAGSHGLRDLHQPHAVGVAVADDPHVPAHARTALGVGHRPRCRPSPSTAPARWPTAVITARPRPAATKRPADSSLGPMLPAGNSPVRRARASRPRR